MTARISDSVSIWRGWPERLRLTSIEDNEGLEADLDLGDEGLDADEEVKDDLEVGLHEDTGVNDETVKLRSAALEDVEVNLKLGDDLDEGLGVDVGLGHNGSWQVLVKW